MAAGSSAPELFTSVIGVAQETDVGVGAIVGWESYIFQILNFLLFQLTFKLKLIRLNQSLLQIHERADTHVMNFMLLAQRLEPGV